MDIGTFFKADSQPTELMKPTVRAFDDPSEDAQAASMLGVALGQHGLNPAPSQSFAMRLRVIGPVALNTPGASPASAFAADLGNRVHQGEQLRHVVGIGSRQRGRQGDALGIGDDVVFRPSLAAIRGIGARLRPPKTARTDVLSTTARDQSICWASSNVWSNTQRILSQTPASCQSRNRRQHVIPDPHPISLGKNSHGMPVLRTNKMPVSTRRLSNGFRPGFRRRRFLGAGRSGSISSHNPLSRIGFAMAVPPCTARQYSQDRRFSQRPFC